MEPTELFDAIRQSWGRDTTDYPDEWDASSNRQRGHCGMSSLVVQDYLGGTMLCSDVSIAGRKVGVHYTNKLLDGRIVDLTPNQFKPEEEVGQAYSIERKPLQPPRFRAERYELLRRRVAEIVGFPS